ncbi:MAG: AmmeMemoRadiSam system protein A [Nitrospirae bacterium]|nr:AmmeMemoRadiSam system protein A [Nitrospirota bacterium]
MHPLVILAKNAIEEYIKSGKKIAVPDNLIPEMKEQAGVFVSLKKHGQLRGCIGTFSPVTKNVAQEIIDNALSSSTKDPRFDPVRTDELSTLEYSVDVLTPPEEVNDISELDPKNYGVIVAEGQGYNQKRGLLLPDLEGVDTVSEQLRIAKMKAGISPLKSDITIYKFKVKRYR